MAATTTTVSFNVTTPDENGKPQAQPITADLIEKLVREAFANAKVPVQDSWVNYQVERATKKWNAFEEIVGSLLS